MTPFAFYVLLPNAVLTYAPRIVGWAGVLIVLAELVVLAWKARDNTEV